MTINHMARYSYNDDEDDSSYNAAKYMNTKGINELFEAMMTALMIHKPDDHITFIRECLNKAEDNPENIHWNLFIKKKSFASTINLKRHISLPTIEDTKPIIFILSSSGSTKLCARLLKRYHHLNYLLINDIANIDDDEPIDLLEHEYRYDCIRQAIEERRSQANGFLIAGELNEQLFLRQWERKLGRINLILILSSVKHQIPSNQYFHIIQIDTDHDFEDILSLAIDYFDQLFPQDAFLSQRSPMISIKSKYFQFPVIFCLNNSNQSNEDDEVFLDNELEEKNSFISNLCQRLANQLSFKYINQIYSNFEELKTQIFQSMGACQGYVIAHFPTSFNDLHRFQSEIGPCSVLIYIGEDQTTDLNKIIERFEENNKAIYVNYRMEIDEIYDGLKTEIFQYIS